MRDDLSASNSDLLQMTLQAAVQDQRTVDEQRRSTAPLLDGMSFHESIRHDDDRGSVTEIYDPRWGWHPDPLVFSYVFTIRSGMVKGWGAAQAARGPLFRSEWRIGTRTVRSAARVEHVRQNLQGLPVR